MASVLEKCVDYLRIVNIALPDEFKSEVIHTLPHYILLSQDVKGVSPFIVFIALTNFTL